MNSGTSLHISMEVLNFLKKFRTNRRKSDTDEEDLAYWKLLEIIAKYFKLNNDAYLELVKLRWNKNV